MDIRYFEELESTNKYCKLLDPAKVEEFTVVVARSQTAGIGQQGNVWASEPGANLTLSVILKPLFLAAADQWQLTMMLALAVAKTITPLLPNRTISIKWPNDIYVGDSKICGILTTSTVSGGHLGVAICGIGLNVNQIAFPSWIPNPTSLALLTGEQHPLIETLHHLLDNIKQEYVVLAENPSIIEKEYLINMYRRGIPSKYIHQGIVFKGTIEGVDRFGHLIVDIAGKGSQTFDLKEIGFLL